MTHHDPTAETYDNLLKAFAYFNETLFSNALPSVMLTLQRSKGARGYFWAQQFRHREDNDGAVDEIALNPEHCGRSVPDVLSTLAHEMVHLRQQVQGKPGKGGYHNRQWGAMMDEIGLTPTSTGAEGGERTGKKVTHMIVPGGPFDVACTALIDGGLALPWFALQQMKVKRTDRSKTLFVCPCCDARAWGKPDLSVSCLPCDEQMQPREKD